MLRRRLDYRLPFFIAIVSYVGGYATVAIGLAVAGFGVWSLVYASLTQSVLSLVAHLVLAPHPLRPSFDRAALAPLLHFGVGTSMSEWMNYIARNGDNFVVGRMLGVESLGLYARAYSLMSLPFTYTTSVMSAVLFPSLSRLQDDQPRLQRAHLLMSRLTAAMSAPMMGTMAVAAAPLILTLYGPRWAGVIAPFQVLCAFGYFRALYHVAGVVAQSAGRVYAELRNQMFYALMVVAGAAIGAVWGVAGVAFGCGLAILFMYVASGHLAARATATTWPMYLRFQLTPVVFGASTAAIALLLRSALERSAVSDPVVALLLVCVGGLGTAASTLVVLSEEPYRPVVSHLPASVEWTVNRVRRVAPARAADGAAAR
jgi:PST family polysaccharide transporter